jgi:hypothetical protein
MMRRWTCALMLGLFVLLGLVLTGRPAASARAQTATPAADGMPPGVSAHPLGLGHVDTLPAAPADLLLIRFTVAPASPFRSTRTTRR